MKEAEERHLSARTPFGLLGDHTNTDEERRVNGL